MDFDPHTLHQIIQRIRQQMRCPQCGEKVPVDMPSMRLSGDDFAILQLKCDCCDAYIVLHASLAGLKAAISPKDDQKSVMNASSSLCEKETNIEELRAVLSSAGGSFEQLFEEKKGE
jgi:hypothetical protein